ncbi:MAG: heme ABC exporter ATP-binding protein CcmA [Alphaproteobacteria bacterium]|nr:heme ABC exporter ATP-binding protein CcmA [Alphaproteobacteria bacterium]MBL7097462.1 heme ABC exporter ATP-binding protein CcmA [Alphaproteobacteria bacterium]
MTTVQYLDIQKLTCIRGQRVLFRDLSFRVDGGQVLSLEGPNGAGKTSLLRVLAGLLPAAGGTVALVSGRGAETDADERGRRVAWLGHNDAAKPQLTPREVLMFFARLYGTRADIDAVLASVGLAKIANLACGYLSAGQKKRLALARLKVAERPVWLLDEPLSSLDADGRKRALDLVNGHVMFGGIVIAATHEPLGVASERLTLGAAA